MLNIKTTSQIKGFLEKNLHKFDSPEAYLGDEPNTKSWTDEEWEAADLRHLLFAPFDYNQAVGNHTIPLLYYYLNNFGKNLVVERNYFPTSHKEVKMLENGGIPIFGLETKHALGLFDIFSISMNYSPYWINVVKALKMSGVPIRWRDRMDMKEKYPLIIAGGIQYAAPWIMCPTVDIVWCGEAEDEGEDNPGVLRVWEDIAEYKKKGMFYDAEGREQMLHELAVKYSFLFVPRFYELEYFDDPTSPKYQQVKGWKKKYPDLPDRIRKRIVRNMDNVPATLAPPVSYHDVGMGIGEIQVARGCSYHCGFCAASYREAPYRERSESVMLESFKENICNTGAGGVAPLTLEFGTYSRKKSLMKNSLEQASSGFAMPSLRIDIFGGDPVFGQLAVAAQKKSLTVAVEGNSQKLREIVSKGITEDDVLRTVANGIAAGYERMKLYMITNLPGETQDEANHIVETMRKIDELRKSVGSKVQIRLSWKPLSVQAWTPFQWFQARNWQSNLSAPIKEIQKMGFGTQLGDEVKSGLGNYIQVAELSDSISAEALTDAIIELDTATYGAIPKRMYELLIRHLAKYGRDIDHYYRQKDDDEIFAWDIIDPLITKEYVFRHYNSIRRRAAEDDTLKIHGKGFLEKFGGCNIGCTECGGCDTPLMRRKFDREPDGTFELMEKFALREDEPVQLKDIKIIDDVSVAQRYFARVFVDPEKRYVQKNHWTAAIRRTARKANLPISKGVKFLSDGIDFKSWLAGTEYVELGFTRALSPNESKTLVETMNENLHGMKFVSFHLVRRDADLLKKKADSVLWSIEVDVDGLTLQKIAASFHEKEYIPMSIKTRNYRAGLVTEKVNAKDFVRDVWCIIDGLKANLVFLAHPRTSPYDVVTALTPGRVDSFRYPAIQIDALVASDSDQRNAFMPDCIDCGRAIPINILGDPFDDDYCPRHKIQTVKELIPV